jgi:type I restriction enzyme S subunit
MKSNYKKLKPFISPRNSLNDGMEVKELLGISNQKYFQKSHTNTIGIDLSTYRIVRTNQFAYNRATTRNGEKISIALRQGNDCIVSPSYRIFQVNNENELLSEYLLMWFKRPEFDRYVRFKSHGSAHEFFEYDQMCDVELPIPTITKQREIVKEYNVIQNRIAINQQLIKKLEETARAIYKDLFVEGIDLENLPDGWTIKKLSDFSDIKGGKRLPKGNELNDEKNGIPYIKVADMTKDKFIVLNDSFQFVSNDIQKSISKYIVQTGDIIISIVGTIGLVNIVDSTLLKANLTENCFRLTNFKFVHSDYLYYYLVSPFGKREIESRTVGGVQAKLPMYNVQSLPVVFPKKEVLQKFEKSLNPINDLQNTLTKETHKLTELKNLLLSKLATIKN